MLCSEDYFLEFNFFYILVSSCWLSSRNNLIWIFATFVAVIEVVSLRCYYCYYYYYNCRYYYRYFLYQDWLLLKIFISRRLPSFQRISTPIDIPLCLSNFHSSWPCMNQVIAWRTIRFSAAHYRDVGVRWLAEHRGLIFYKDSEFSFFKRS